MGEWLLSGGAKYIFRAEPLIKLAFMGYPGRVGSARTGFRAVAPTIAMKLYRSTCSTKTHYRMRRIRFLE
jgi:hypothetical protein